MRPGAANRSGHRTQPPSGGSWSAPEAHRLAATIEAWWPAIEAGILTGFSNARTEGYNRVVKQIKRVACGFSGYSVQQTTGDERVTHVACVQRDVTKIIHAPFEPRHYRAVANVARTFPQPVTTVTRYLTNRGTYPWTIDIATPVGRVPVTMYSSHDLLTVNEIFARQDYGNGDGVEIVVDFGANIGVSALYFLTRRTTSRVYCFEPDPRNAERPRNGLLGFEDRYALTEAAVAVEGGRATFMREDTGRYGHLLHVGNQPNTTPLEVEVLAAVGALDEVIDREGRIDLLKIDTEGNEEAIVTAIPHKTMAKIGQVYFENNARVFHLP